MTLQSDPRLVRSLQHLSTVLSVIVVLIGCLVLFGWIFDVTALKGVFTGLVSMKANTAVSFVLSGLSLVLLQTGWASRWLRVAAQLCAGVAILLGMLNLGEYLFDQDFGIDQLLFEDVQLGPLPPGRMATATALDFVIIGFALLLLSVRSRRYLLAQVLSLPPIALSILALLGYAYGVESLYAVGPYLSQALHTALLFIPLSLGILFAYPDHGLMASITSESAGGFMLRRLLIAGIGVPFFPGWFVLAGEQAGIYDAPFGLALLAMSSTIVFTVLISLSSRSLHRIDIQRRNATREQVRLAEIAQRRAAELDAANRELEAFSYSVSHDLRAPLRHIDGFSKILLKEYADKLDERGKQYLQFLREGSQKMEQLIDALLKLSRATRAEMKLEPVDLSALATSILAELHEEHPERQVKLTIAPDVVANGDPQLLRIVLENLLGNVWKFTSRRPVARIEFGATCQDDKPIYFVKDNGVGFDMAYVDKLFGAFQRLHRTEEFPGTGIGLATVQRIIHRHGGRVWAEGEVDKGAIFYFTL